MTVEPDVPMLERLTRRNLCGVWAALATPFDEDGAFDPGVLRENIRRLHAAGVHGVYTTDSDGEFYAIEIDEFREIVAVLTSECAAVGLPAQVGCTWSSTAGVVDRLRVCVENGVLGAHVGHPFFMPMHRDAVRVFWDDLAKAVPEGFALVHYNTPRCPNYLRGADYASLAAEIPALVGVKFVSTDFLEFLDLVRSVPELSVFVSEGAFAPFFPYGARGVYSWLANINAAYMLGWYDELVAGRRDEADRRQERVHAYGRATDFVREGGNFHAAVNKARAASSRFLVPSNRTRGPYLAISEEEVERLREVLESEFPDLSWKSG